MPTKKGGILAARFTPGGLGLKVELLIAGRRLGLMLPLRPIARLPSAWMPQCDSTQRECGTGAMNQQKPDGHPGARKLTDSMSHQLGVTARRVARLFSAQYVKQCKVKPTEWRALAVIAGQGTATPSAISAESHMDKVDVSRAVAGLVNRGLVKRASDAHDGRVFQLSLTRKGEAAHAAAQSLTSKMEAVLADGMSKADFAALWKGLKLLEEQASKLAAELDASGA